jgi:poly(3-hydroxybutyrate) depolymerase
MWYESMEAQRRFFQSLCEWWMPDYRWPDRPCEPPPFGISSIRSGERSIPVVESVLDRTPFCELRHFARVEGAAAGQLGQVGSTAASIFVCAPLAGHHAVMLREMVETLLQNADVYVTDWTDARDVPLAAGPFGLNDYILVLERFLRKIGSAHLHVIAVCQATVPALATSALLASAGIAEPLSLTLMGGPIDTRLHPTAIDQLAQAHNIDWFRNVAIGIVSPPYPGSGRRVYPGSIQHAAIVAAQPRRHLALELGYWSSRMSGDTETMAQNLRSLREYSAVLDMAEDYFLDMIRVVFQEQHLARGQWRVGERRVCPQDLSSTALCTVEGDRDDITGEGQTHAAHKLCNAIPVQKHHQLTIDDCDHYDLFTGSKWQDVIHPAVGQFWRSLVLV